MRLGGAWIHNAAAPDRRGPHQRGRARQGPFRELNVNRPRRESSSSCCCCRRRESGGGADESAVTNAAAASATLPGTRRPFVDLPVNSAALPFSRSLSLCTWRAVSAAEWSSRLRVVCVGVSEGREP
ncbi:unnamed protein product [Lampetra planeri]